MAEFVTVARVGDLGPGEVKLVEIGELRIALTNVDGSFFAVDDACPHVQGPLSEGGLEGEVITCPWHGSRFDVRSGELLGAPATTGVSSYAVRVEGDDVQIER